MSKEEVSLKEYIEALLSELDKRVDQRFEDSGVALAAALASAEKIVKAAQEAADRAVAKAENASERRFEGVNEFRAQLTDQANTFLPRAEFNVSHKAIQEQVDRNTEAILRAAGKSTGMDSGVRYIVMAVGFVLTVLSIVVLIITLTHKVSAAPINTQTTTTIQSVSK